MINMACINSCVIYLPNVQASDGKPLISVTKPQQSQRHQIGNMEADLKAFLEASYPLQI